MRLKVVVEIVVERSVNGFGFLPPQPLTLKVENIVFKTRVDRRAALRKHVSFQPSTGVVSIVVDVDVLSFEFLVEAVKVKSLPLVLSDIVSDHNVAIGPFHNAAKPLVVVAVVVLNERVDAVEICVKTASIHVFLAHVSVSFIVLDPNPIRIEAKDTVASVITTTVGQRVVFVDRIFTGSGNHIVATRLIDVVLRDVHIGP